MSKQQSVEVVAVICGIGTTISIGQILFQGLGAVILGILGALGGYIFSRLIKPYVDRWIGRKKAE